MDFWRRLLLDTKGAPAIEYALVAALIAVAAIVGYQRLGSEIQNSFSNAAETVEAA